MPYRFIVQVVEIVLAAVDVPEQFRIVLKVKEDGRGAEVERLSVAPAAVCEHVQLGSRLDRQCQIRPNAVEELQHLDEVSGEQRKDTIDFLTNTYSRYFKLLHVLRFFSLPKVK